MQIKKIYIKKKWLLLFLTFIFFICFYAVFFLKEPYEIFLAKELKKKFELHSKGLVLRNEKVIKFNERLKDNTIIEYNKKNGEHVEMNEPIAKFYNLGSKVLPFNKFEYAKNQKEKLIELNDNAAKFYGSFNVLTKSISDQLIKLIRDINNNLLETYESELNFIATVNKKHLATGKETNFLKRINQLEKQIKQYGINSNNIVSTYFAKITGCFCNKIDGCESQVKASIVENKNIKDAFYQKLYKNIENKIKNRKLAATYGAKIIEGYEWYIIIPIEETDANNIIKHNLKTTLDFEFKNGKNIPAQFVKLVSTNDKNKKMIIFKCNYMNSDLAEIRMANVTICIESKEGIVCPISAVRFLKGEKGVFVKEGNLVKFKKIKGLYEDKKIIISEKVDNNKYLAPLDEVIVSGGRS